MYDSAKRSQDISPEQKLKIAKALFVLFCLSGFFCNSYLIFAQFIEGKTILSNDLKSPENGMLQAPAILVCGKMSFEQNILNTNLSEFTENSLKLNEFLENSYFFNHVDRLDNPLSEDVTDQWQPFYTAFYGTCHKLEVGKMVRKQIFIAI